MYQGLLVQLKDKVLLVISGVTSAIASVFAFLFFHQKNKSLKEKNNQLENEVNVNKEVSKRYANAKKENEKLVQKATSGNSVDSFSASVELLQKLSDKH